MKLKKILSGLLIGAFVFGVTAGDVSAANSTDKKNPAIQTADNQKQPPQMKNGNKNNPPEPPKDENGNPLPPPDRKDDLNNDKNASDNQKQPPQLTADKNQNKK